MKTLIAAAALGLTALAATPALAWDPIYNNPNNTNNIVSPGADNSGFGYRGDYGYRYNSGYGDPAWESGERIVAVCPPGYHLGRSNRQCWPD